MLKMNREEYLQKVHACWLGKNIGGTIGTPYEGKRDMNDVQGFSSPKGQMLPNDDLDLQLIWLCAMEEHGPHKLSAQILGEYWLSYIPAPWNEYGIGKSNMRLGLLPPICGEYANERWKNSNGAWIRSEIWACLCPGEPDMAIRYARMDAMVDHGLGEGTYAELFTAAMESAAFFEKDINKLLELGLAEIPEDCRVARSVRLAREQFDKGVSLQEAREALVADSADLGWFQAPANVGFVVLGLLYGGGDFKKSVLYAVNCGDDTDCTGATVGALIGIIGGMEAIPADWQEHIGDEIVSVAIDLSCGSRAKSCTELTNRIYQLVPSVFKANDCYMEFTDGETEWVEGEKAGWFKVPRLAPAKTPWSYELPDMVYAAGRVEFGREPVVAPGDSIQVNLRFINRMRAPLPLFFRLYLPEGWTADGFRKSLYLNHEYKEAIWSVTLTAGEQVEPINRTVVEVTTPGRPTVGYLPITVLG